jgi:hypothetical protein
MSLQTPIINRVLQRKLYREAKAKALGIEAFVLPAATDQVIE